jgi:hypothetical protein
MISRPIHGSIPEISKIFPKLDFNDFYGQIVPEIDGSTRECPDQSMEASQKFLKFSQNLILMTFLYK